MTEPVRQRRRHGDVPAREIGVVIFAVRHLEAGGRLLAEAGEDRIDILRPALARLDDQRQIGRQRAAVVGAGGLLVGEGRREMIGRRAGRISGCPCRRRSRPCRWARPEPCSPPRSPCAWASVKPGPPGSARSWNATWLRPMAGRADFLVDLEAALQRAAVIGAERAFEGPLPRPWAAARAGVQREGRRCEAQKAEAPRPSGSSRSDAWWFSLGGCRGGVAEHGFGDGSREGSWASRSGRQCGMISQKKT